MMKGWARFMYEDKPTLVKAGDVVHQRPGIVHYLYDYSPDMEYMEIVRPPTSRRSRCRRRPTTCRRSRPGPERQICFSVSLWHPVAASGRRLPLTMWWVVSDVSDI